MVYLSALGSCGAVTALLPYLASNIPTRNPLSIKRFTRPHPTSHGQNMIALGQRLGQAASLSLMKFELR